MNIIYKKSERIKVVDEINGRTIIKDGFHIPLNPDLANIIGLNEAIFMQQLHYWLTGTSAKKLDGRLWIYNTYKEWENQFPFWSARTIKRIVEKLDEENLIIKGNYNKKAYDKTIWYSINYKELSKITNEITERKATCQNGTRVSKNTDDKKNAVKPSDKVASPIVTKWHHGGGQNVTTNTIDYTKTTTKNKEQNINSQELTPTHPLNDLNRINKVIHNVGLAKVIQYYSETYKFLYGEEHPNYKESQIIDVANTLEELSDEIHTFGDWKELINEHFRSENVGDGRLSFFASGDAEQGVIAGILKEGE